MSKSLSLSQSAIADLPAYFFTAKKELRAKRVCCSWKVDFRLLFSHLGLYRIHQRRCHSSNYWIRCRRPIIPLGADDGVLTALWSFSRCGLDTDFCRGQCICQVKAMPTITFATPPGRLSFFQPSGSATPTVGESQSRLPEAPVSPKSHGPSDLSGMGEPVPLAFPKRSVLSPLTTSPELTQTEKASKDPTSEAEEFAANPATDALPRRSLLSNALASGSSQVAPSIATKSCGILRRGSEVTGAADRVRTDLNESHDLAVNRPRLHFQQPEASARSKTDPVVDLDSSTKPSHSVAPLESQTAPKKRSLVIQEHADVIERAAERAARQASNADSPNLDQPSHPATIGRPRLYSMSSVGDETTSNVSTHSRRSSSRGSSIPTSPSMGYISADKLDPSGELTSPLFSDQGGLMITHGSPELQADLSTALSRPAPRLTFANDGSRPDRNGPKVAFSPGMGSLARRPSVVCQTFDRPAFSDDDRGEVTTPSNRRALSFSSCPKPDRNAEKHSPQESHRCRKKLSASPAPHTLPYQQRLRGIRGSQPIRSPAPGESTTYDHASQYPDHDIDSGEGSGYSEDEENSSNDDDSDVSDNDSDSMRKNTDDEEGDGDSGLNMSPQLDNEQVDAAGILSQRRLSGSAKYALHRSLSDNPSNFSSQSANLSRVASRSASISPYPRGARKSQTDSQEVYSSHPMCFLPDTFEDSVPPSEQESDVIPRSHSNLGQPNDSTSASSSRRPSWQHLALEPNSRAAGGGEPAEPVTMPPFRRGRQTAHPGVMSDGEQSGSLFGHATSLRGTSGFPSSLPRTATAGTQTPERKEVSDHRYPQPFMWRHLPSKTMPKVDTKSLSLRRASHSTEPAKARSALSSPIGSLSPGLVASTQSFGQGRPGMKQRAVSVAGPARSRVSMAPLTRDTVNGATSPPSEDAFSHLKLYLASSPMNEASGSRSPGSGSEAVTPGWSSDGQPSLGTSRYWTERLSSLAQAMTDEMYHVGNAVLGYDQKAISAIGPSVESVQPAQRHERSHTVPCERFANLDISSDSTSQRNVSTVEANKTLALDRPKPIRIATAAPAIHWSSDRDGEAQTGRRTRPAAQKRHKTTGGSASPDDADTPSSQFRFHRQEVGQDGHTHLIVVRDSVH